MKKHEIIPSYWTAEEAWLICSYLDCLIDAIWNVHGPQMARHLDRTRLLDDTEPPDCSDLVCDDDLPF